MLKLVDTPVGLVGLFCLCPQGVDFSFVLTCDLLLFNGAFLKGFLILFTTKTHPDAISGYQEQTTTKELFPVVSDEFRYIFG